MMKGKLIFFGIFTSLCIVFLLGRIMFIQTVHGEDFERRVIERTARSATHVETFNAVRGQVFDRNRNLLASTFTRDNIVMDIRELHSIGEEDARRGWTRQENTLHNLHVHLGIPMHELHELLAVDASGNLINDTHYRIIARDVDPIVTLAMLQDGVRAVFAEPVSMRSFVPPLRRRCWVLCGGIPASGWKVALGVNLPGSLAVL